MRSSRRGSWQPGGPGRGPHLQRLWRRRADHGQLQQRAFHLETERRARSACLRGRRAGVVRLGGVAVRRLPALGSRRGAGDHPMKGVQRRLRRSPAGGPLRRRQWGRRGGAGGGCTRGQQWRTRQRRLVGVGQIGGAGCGRPSCDSISSPQQLNFNLVRLRGTPRRLLAAA